MNIINNLHNELTEFIDKNIAISDYCNYNGEPDNILRLAEIEIVNDTQLELFCEYHRKLFQREVKKSNNAIAGWTVKNKKDKFLPIIITVTENHDNFQNSILMESLYQGNTAIAAIRYIDEECVFNSFESNIESKTVNELLSKTFEIIKIRF
jgi:hypothetical protein